MGLLEGKNVAINEVVAFLDACFPEKLEVLRQQLPALSSALEVGIMAGEQEVESNTDALLYDKATFTLQALELASKRCESGMQAALVKIQKAKKIRLAGQAFSFIGSSVVIASILANQNTIALITGSFALAGSLLALGADHNRDIK